jgi:hypothetical protein
VLFSYCVCQDVVAGSQQQTIRTAVTLMGALSLTWQELRVSASGGQVQRTGHDGVMLQCVQGRSIFNSLLETSMCSGPCHCVKLFTVTNDELFVK